MLDTISIGGATYDLFIRTEKELIHEYSGKKSIALPFGSKIKVKEVIETCGGGASNTAVGLSRLGCSAGFCGVIGSDQWGEKLINNLKKENINIDCMTIVENETTSFSVILSASSGERCILYTPGTNIHLHDANFNKDVIKETNWVYLNHIQEDSCVIQDDIIEMLAKDASPRFTWNPGGCQIEEGISASNNKILLSHTDLIILNEEESIEFTKSQHKEEALKILIEIGAKNACITQGEKGTLACDGKNIYYCPSITDVEVIDTTGAGDAFGTGVTWGLINNKSLPEAIKAGTINAVSVVSKIGAQAGLLTDIEIIQKLESINLSVNIFD